MVEALFTTELADLELVHRGKVRDMYAIDAHELLMVATDRISAFDKVITSPIPAKGIILSELASFWFQKLTDTVPNHWLAGPVPSMRVGTKGIELPTAISRRAMRVTRKKRFDIECIVRGYLTGSAWRDYQKTGFLNGIKLPAGLQENSKFDEPLFTPSTKAAVGTHDEPLTRQQGEDIVGVANYARLQELSLRLYAQASAYLAQKNLILVDTKFEFGVGDEDDIVLIDEIFTPDSSRFWDLGDWQAGQQVEPLDKEFLRKWLLETGQNATNGKIVLPNELVKQTQGRYINLYERVLDRKFDG